MDDLPKRKLRVRQLVIIFFSLLCLIAVGCSPSPDRNAGENIQLQQRLTEKEKKIAELEEKNGKLQEQNTRLQTKVAEYTSGTYQKEDEQRVLDDRKAALDSREKNLIERESFVENQLLQRRAEAVSEFKEREDAVNKREISIAKKEQDFYEKSNMTMEDIGEAREIKERYDEMKLEKNEANAKAEKWLAFVWYVSIGLAVSVFVCIALVFVMISKQVSTQREHVERREAIQVLSKVIDAQLPAEQQRLAIDAMKRLTRLESSSKKQE